MMGRPIKGRLENDGAFCRRGPLPRSVFPGALVLGDYAATLGTALRGGPRGKTARDSGQQPVSISSLPTAA